MLNEKTQFAMVRAFSHASKVLYAVYKYVVVYLAGSKKKASVIASRPYLVINWHSFMYFIPKQWSMATSSCLKIAQMSCIVAALIRVTDTKKLHGLLRHKSALRQVPENSWPKINHLSPSYIDGASSSFLKWKPLTIGRQASLKLLLYTIIPARTEIS